MTARHDKQVLLSDLRDLASRARDANVTAATQRAIDYAVAELEAEAEPSRPSAPPSINAQVRDGANAAFRRSRAILRGVLK
jgi:hypothetical protein